MVHSGIRFTDGSTGILITGGTWRIANFSDISENYLGFFEKI